MGAWGSGSFDNDDAADWLGDFSDDPDRAMILDTLSAVVETDGYLDASDCSAGIAAAEIVAAMNGAPHPDLSDEAREGIANLQDGAGRDAVALALRAIERIRMDSELKELWEETDEPGEWYGAIEELEGRLNLNSGTA